MITFIVKSFFTHLSDATVKSVKHTEDTSDNSFSGMNLMGNTTLAWFLRSQQDVEDVQADIGDLGNEVVVDTQERWHAGSHLPNLVADGVVQAPNVCQNRQVDRETFPTQHTFLISSDTAVQSRGSQADGAIPL